MPVAPTSTAELLDLVRKSGLVAKDHAGLIGDPAGLPPEPTKAASLLVRKGVLTKFQALQLLAGRHKGFRLGQYAVQDLLGRGGMGAVYLAEHLDLHRKVAIKVLMVGKEHDQRLATERFLREARAAAALDHPNIVRIFDVARHNDAPYLVMEYVPGETLQQTLDRDGPLPYSTAADYTAQAAAGLQHAHEKGFIHRDIKPGNLIRDTSGTVKLLDMGLARSFTADRDKLTERLDAGAVVGTADFIAPEQAMNVPQIDIRADIYSLGATFFALITGKPPFEGNTTQKLLQHQLKTAPALSAMDATLPSGLTAVAAKMLAKKPGERYQTPAEVIAALAPWLGNSTRVMAGISRTNLGQGAELHAALNDQARTGTRSPGGSVVVLDAQRSLPAMGQDTVAVAASETTRSPNPSRTPERPAAPGRSRVLLYAGTGVAFLAAGALAFWLIFGAKKPADPGPAATPPADVVKAPKDPLPPAPQPPSEPVAYRLDLAAQKPFTIRTGLEVKANNQRELKQLARTGAGMPPAGWVSWCWHLDTQVEFFAEDGPALGIRNVRGPASAMLFMPHFDCSTGACRLKLEYSAPVKGNLFLIRFKPADARPAWDVVRPPATAAGAWRAEKYVVDLQGATGGYFEFHNSDPSPDAALRLRALTVSDAPPSAVPTVPPPAPAIAADHAKWKDGATLYKLDVGAIPAFRVTKEGGKRTAGDEEKLPLGMRCYCWKQAATGEFRRETLDGVPALGVTNFSDEMSAQFTWELEQDLKLDLKPGKAYRVKVEYTTRNEAHGGFTVQTTEFKNVGGVALPNTAGQWKTATASFVRPENIAVRLTIDNNSVGEGNTLHIRSVELVELLDPSK